MSYSTIDFLLKATIAYEVYMTECKAEGEEFGSRRFAKVRLLTTAHEYTHHQVRLLLHAIPNDPKYIQNIQIFMKLLQKKRGNHCLGARDGVGQLSLPLRCFFWRQSEWPGAQ